MALSLEELKEYPTSILASGGEHKLAVIRAVLNAGYVRRLVTDEGVAAELACGQGDSGWSEAVRHRD